MKTTELKQNLFIIILRYKASLEKIDALRASHLEFLQHHYDSNIFITSGPQVPRNGGIILAKCDTKDRLQAIITKDPFAINDLATYEIIEFAPTKWSNLFGNILFD